MSQPEKKDFHSETHSGERGAITMSYCMTCGSKMEGRVLFAYYDPGNGKKSYGVDLFCPNWVKPVGLRNKLKQAWTPEHAPRRLTEGDELGCGITMQEADFREWGLRPPDANGLCLPL